jgi:hypothetical protein
LNYTPAPSQTDSFTITLSPVGSAAYTTDFSTTPAATNGTTIRKAVAAGQTIDSILVTIVPNNAAGINDTINFGLSSFSGNLTSGPTNSTRLIIVGPAIPPVSTIPVYTIATIKGNNGAGQPDSLGVKCRIRGTVYGTNLRTSGVQFTIRDNTGGFGVFKSTAINYTNVVEGDSVEVFGTVAVFRGLGQMTADSVFVLGTGVLKTPRIIPSTDTLKEEDESDLVRINGVTITSGTWPTSGTSSTLTVSNGTNTYTVRINSISDIDGSAAPSGSFDIVGIGSQFSSSTTSPFSGGYQLIPRRLTDIITGSGPVSTKVSFNTSNTTTTYSAINSKLYININPAPTQTDSFTITINPLGNTSYSTDFTTIPSAINGTSIRRVVTAGQTLDSIIVNIVGNNTAGVNDTIDFTLSGFTGNLSAGTTATSRLIILGPSAPPVSNIPVYSISTIIGANTAGQPDSLGVKCRIRGTVYGTNLRTTGVQFTIRDNTGGFGVFRNTAINYTNVVEGDSVEVFGTVAVFRGLGQMTADSVFVLGTGKLKTPRIIPATDTLKEADESDLIRINGVSISSGSWPASGASATLTVSNGTNSYTMRINSITDIDGTVAPSGSFDVVGIGSQFTTSTTSPFSGGYQIIPRRLTDIITGSKDLTVQSIQSPSTPMQKDSVADVKVWIKNIGTIPSGSYYASYRINGGSPVIDTINTSLNAGDSVLYTFKKPFKATNCGAFSLQAYATVAGDANPSNDSSSIVNTVQFILPQINLTVGDTVFCAGSGSATLNAPYNNLSVSWYKDNVNTGISGTTFNTTTSGVYYAVVSDQAASCSNPSNSIRITVNPVPAVPVISTNGPTTICQNSNVGMQTSATGILVWLKDNVVINGQTSNTYVATQSGNYTVKVTDANGCSSSSAAISVTVNPTVNVSVVINTLSNSVCGGSNVTFNAQAQNPGTSPVYSWSKNGIPVGTNAASYTTSNLSNGDVIGLTMTSNVSCPSQASVAATPIVMNVNAPSTVYASIKSTKSSACAGETINFSIDSSANLGLTPSYSWYLNNQLVGSSASYSSSTLSNLDSVYVTVQSSASCVVSNVTKSNTVVTTVNNVVSPAVSLPFSSLVICQGESVRFNASGSFTGNAPAYLWYVNNNLVSSTPSGTVILPNLTSQDIVMVKLVSNAVCRTVDTVSSAQVSITSIANQSPSVSITASKTSLCGNENVTFTALPVLGGLTPTYVWKRNGQTVGTNDDSLVLTNINDYDSIWVEMTSSSSCANPILTSSTHIIMRVYSIPIAPSISSTNGQSSFCTGGFLALTSSGGSNLQWMRNGVDVVGETGNSFIALTAGNYSLKTTNTGGCVGISNVFTVNINPLPNTPTIAANGPTQFCAGDSVSLSVSVNSGIEWFKDNTLINGSVSQTLVIKDQGRYYVRYTDANGCSSSSIDTFIKVNPLPVKPIITSLSNTSFCDGGSVKLVSSYSSDNHWIKDGIVLPSTTDTIIVTTSGLYQVAQTNAFGCTNISDTVSTTVRPVPAAFSIQNLDTTTFCQGGSVRLVAPSGQANYQWTVNTVDIAGANSDTLVVTSSGAYAVRITNASNCSTISTNTVQVFVNPLPAIPTITSATPLRFCLGGNVVLKSSFSGNNIWSKDGINLQPNSDSLLAVASGNYTVTAINAFGCKASSASVTVVVDTLPSAPIITAASSTTFCNGDSVILQSSYSSGNQWFFGNTPIANSTTLVAAVSGSYTVKYTDANTCSSTSAPTTVSVNPLPVVGNLNLGGPTTFCANSSIVLRTNVVGTKQWFAGSSPIPSATADTLWVNQSGNYSVKVTNGFGCSAFSSVAAITVNPMPVTPTITANGSLTFCSGGSVKLMTSSTTNQWYNAQNAIAGATADTLIVTASGTFSVMTTNAFGCSSLSSAVVVTVNPLPLKPTITRINDSLVSSSTLGNQWYVLGSGAISGANGQGYVPTQANGGQYFVVVTLSGCSSPSSDTIAFIGSGVRSLSASYQYIVYPNPASQLLNVRFDEESRDAVRIELLDLSGRSLYTQSIEGFVTGQVQTLDISSLASGSYLVRMSSDKKSAVSRVQIVR